MIKHYITIALRNIRRSKVHSLINVLGLSMGIACCVLIVLFVKDEWTFDSFHAKAERIYRAYVKEDYGPDQQFFNTVTPFPLGPALKNNFPEVEHQVRVNQLGTQIKSGNQVFTEQVTVVGEHFFDVFDFELVRGTKDHALDDMAGVLITERAATKYFGAEDPLNKTLSISLKENFEEFIVKGIVKNPPTNSSIQFDILISDLNYTRFLDERVLTSGWFNVNPETYILIQEGVSVQSVTDKFPALFRSVLGEDDYNNSKYTVGLQPFTSIHLDTSYPTGIAQVNNPRYSYILGAVALLILFVACINFVTLSIGRSLKRSKEVGIRKVVGALRNQLIYQFIGEAVLITILSLVIGFVLAELFLPLFNTLAAKQLVIEYNGFIFILSFLLLLIIGLFAGSYPAFVLSNFRPVSILKGSIHGINNRQGLRKVLVGIQLVLSIFLISSTLIMQNQLRFLQDKNLGYDREQLAVVPLNVPRGQGFIDRINSGFDLVQQYKNELSRIPEITGVCGSSHDFGHGGWVKVGYTDDQGTYRNFSINTVEPDYFDVLKMEIKFGRPFDKNNPSDKRRAVIVNEAFVKDMGWNEPVGMKLPGKNFPDHEVVGVVKDFNYESLYTSVKPLVLVLDPKVLAPGFENINIESSPMPKLFIRMKPGNMMTTVEQVKQVWDKLTGGEEFVFNFVDLELNRQYASERNLGKIISIATGLAIFIGSLGLYGLASLAIQNRTKEISLRKVFGATRQSLMILLSKDYIVLVVISLFISIPATLYLMGQWLQSFEYKVSIGWNVFALSGIIALLIALIVISFQVIKSTTASPAQTLKYE